MCGVREMLLSATRTEADRGSASFAGTVDYRWVRRAHRGRPRVVVLGLASALLLFLAYCFGFDRAIRPIPGAGALHPLSLLCGVLLLLAVRAYRPLRRQSGTEYYLAGAALLVAALRLAEYALFAPAAPVSDLLVPVAAPGQPSIRMGPNTAATAVLIAAGLLLHARHPRLGAVCSALAPFFPALGMLGYFYGLGDFHGDMSATTAVLYMLICSATVSIYAHSRPVRILFRGDLAGRLLRLQIALATLFFVVAGAVFSTRDIAQSVPLIAAAGIWFVSGMLLLTSQAFERADVLRRRLERQMARQSLTDELTQLSNRRAAEVMGGKLFAQARRARRALSVILMDIDHFKRINDTHGHNAGDEVLRDMGAVLNGRLRRSDVVARWGGEEFIAILPDTPEVDAHGVAETLRRRISDRVHVGGVPVSVSIGVASAAISDVSLSAVVDRADAALYAAKRGGRDRVVSCRDLASTLKLGSELCSGIGCKRSTRSGKRAICEACPVHAGLESDDAPLRPRSAV